ncbi:MAG: aldose epimerase family protein [Adhaeribacter sp.]
MKKIKLKALFLAAVLGLGSTTLLDSCTQAGSRTAAPGNQAKKSMRMKTESFGQTSDGQQVQLYTLRNENGMQVQITNYGGIVTSILTPDKTGKPGDVALGFDNLEAYIRNNPFFGATVGRYGNRIAKGKFSLDGQEYTLATNNGPNHLHGGKKGFDKVVWAAEPAGDNTLKLTYLSKDGEEGYPGNLSTTVTFSLSEDNELKIAYQATTDKATPVNLTNHSYFNLSAGAAETVLQHEVTIKADRFTVVDDKLIPTGELRPVAGTVMDFTKPTPIGTRIAQVEGGGYDHNYVLRDAKGPLQLAATVSEPVSGRVMEVYTTEPGIQFYSGNFLNGKVTGKGNVAYKKHSGFCLETQHFHDSPNQPGFPSTILRPGETYQTTTVYKFSVKK